VGGSPKDRRFGGGSGPANPPATEKIPTKGKERNLVAVEKKVQAEKLKMNRKENNTLRGNGINTNKERKYEWSVVYLRKGGTEGHCTGKGSKGSEKKPRDAWEGPTLGVFERPKHR